MFSTGNDIVSLADINVLRTQEPVFYKKILSEAEIIQYQQEYSGAISFINYVWLLWSIKESGYKYLQRIDPELLFSPTKFVVNNLVCPLKSRTEPFNGSIIEQKGFEEETVHTARVTHGKNTLRSRSTFYPDMVHSVVHHTESFDSVNWGIKTITSTDAKSQSEAVRAFLLNKLKTVFFDNQLQVSKSKHGVPFVMHRQKQIPILVSFSHHKQFIAYSFIAKQAGHQQNKLYANQSKAIGFL
jgi:phosphopantetheinyl transferase (holo-ACP synthase)